MAKRPVDDQMDRNQRRRTEESLKDCKERLNNDNSLSRELEDLSSQLNCRETTDKIHKFLKLVKTKKENKIKRKYSKCVDAVKNVIEGVDDLMKVFNVPESTDQKDERASIESDEIKLLGHDRKFHVKVEEQLKELKTYNMKEIRTDLKELVNFMKTGRKKNRSEVDENCVKKFKHCVSSWKKSRSTAEKIRKILVGDDGDDKHPQKRDGRKERNTEEHSVVEHTPSKQQRTSDAASPCDVKITIENEGPNDVKTAGDPDRNVKALEFETRTDTETTGTKDFKINMQEGTAQDQTEEKEKTYLEHKGVDLQEVGNGIQSFSRVNGSELKRTEKEIERLNEKLQRKENRIQELAGLLKEKKNEENAIRNEFERNYNRKIKDLEGLVDKQKHLTEKEKRQKEETEKRLADQIQETEAEQKTKEDALIRLSEMTSMQLRSNNPNIVDLSDLNRPTKIGEQLSELYDKEWTDAFEDLMKEKSEREAIKILHNVIMEAHTSCLGLSSIENMLKNIEMDFLQGPIDVEVRQKLVDLRKRNALISLENVTKKLEPDILSKLSGGSSSEALIMYVDACIRICWFMAIQDPPLRLYNIQRKEFDKEKYREYTQRGMYTDFVVWPALCLHEGGPLLAKGIAQGSKDSIEDKPPTPVAPEPASTDNCAPVKAESPKEKTVHEEKQPPIKHVSSVPVQAPLSENTMNINESKQQNRESDGMKRPKKEENPTAETVSSDKQASSIQFVSTIMVSQTGNPISSTKEEGRKVGSDDSLNNEIKSANAKETVGHRREMNAIVGVSQTAEVGCLNEEDTTVTAL